LVARHVEVGAVVVLRLAPFDGVGRRLARGARLVVQLRPALLLLAVPYPGHHDLLANGAVPHPPVKPSFEQCPAPPGRSPSTGYPRANLPPCLRIAGMIPYVPGLATRTVAPSETPHVVARSPQDLQALRISLG